jgi:hypothetical protein
MNTKLTPPPVRTPMQSPNGLSHAWHVWFNEIKDYLAIGSFTPSAHTQDWNTITNTPATYPPSAHNQEWSTITNTPTTLAGYGITDAANIVHYHSSLMASDGSPNPALSMNAAGYGEFSNSANANLVSIVAINNNATLAFQTDYGSTSIIQGGSAYASHGGANSLNFVNANATPITFYQGANQRLIIDGIGNVGIGRVPEAWHSSYTALQIGGSSSIMVRSIESAGELTFINHNVYFDGQWKRGFNDPVSQFYLGDGIFVWRSNPADVADVGFNPIERMRLTIAGNLGIGTSVPNSILELSQAGTVKAITDFLTITNTQNAADMDGTGSSILFRQYYYNATTPAVFNAGKLSFSCIADPTSNVSTQDIRFKMSMHKDGSVVDYLDVLGDNTAIWNFYQNDGSLMTADQMTAFGLTNDTQFLKIGQGSNSSRGVMFSGYRTNSGSAMIFRAYQGLATTTSAAFEFSARLHDGAGAITTLGNTDKILEISNNAIDIFTMFGGGTQYLRNSSTAHPMTDIAPADVFGRFAGDTTFSGLNIDGFSDLGTTGLTLTGYFSSVCSGYAAVVVDGYISDGGTGVEAVPTNHRLFSVNNAGSELLNVNGAGGTNIGISITSARLAVDDSCGFVTVDSYAGLAIRTTCAADLVKGQVVSWDPLNNSRVVPTPANGDMPMGIAWADTTSGGTLWVIQAGYAWVQMKSGVTATRGDIVHMSNTIGVADTSNTIPSVTLHNREIGHCVATSSSGGLALCTLHFN